MVKIGSVNGGLKAKKEDAEPDFSFFDSATEMVKNPHAYRILIYGKSGVGKTHFILSAPAPVINLDCENRTPIIVGKFSDENGAQKKIWCKQWSTFEELLEAADKAIDTLVAFRKKTNINGTIGIDSMSREWDEIHNSFIEEKFGKDAKRSDVKLDPMTDYKKLNEMHNKLLKKLFDSGLNVILTAHAKADYQEDRYNPSGVKPEGQKYLPHMVDYSIFNYGKDNTLYSQVQKNSLMLTELSDVQMMDFPKFEKLVNTLKNRAKIRTYEDMMKEIEEQKKAEEVEKIELEDDDVPEIEKIDVNEPESTPESESKSESETPETEVVEEKIEEKVEETPSEAEEIGNGMDGVSSKVPKVAIKLGKK